ncbi:MAG: hypothetical protein ABL890_02735 [Candidatus Peribacteraceae bacterium]
MSLQHLLEAITSEAKHSVAQAENAAATRMSQKKEVQKKALGVRKQEIDDQVEKRKVFLRSKAETHAKLSMRAAVLTRKQENIDSIFSAAFESICALSDKEVEPLLSSLLGSLPQGGEIRPSKKHDALIKKLAQGRTIGAPIDAKGGFLFVSATLERNCTFEHLVLSELRSRKELEVARALAA